MTDAPSSPLPVVADTVIASARLTGRMTAEVRSLLARITGVPIVLALQTVAELRFGAINAGWGLRRREQLEAFIAGLDVAPPDDAVATQWAVLRHQARQAGHGLAHKEHDGDRWIAATAIRYGLPLVTADRIFEGVPRLDLVLP